jgi:hypothetical protein
MQWFKHDTDATQDAKIKKLIIRHGAIGYAVYFHCLELIAAETSESNLTFELEHDSEIIADNLHIDGTKDKSGTEIVEEIMRFIVDLGLFSESSGHVFCFKLLKRLDSSMSSSPRFRKMLAEAKESHDTVMIPSCQNHDSIMQEENRIEKKRIDENRIPEPPKQKSPSHIYGNEKNVTLTDDQYSKLVSDLGEPMVKACIDELSTAKAMKGYKYKRDDLAIRKWVVRAVTEKKEKGANPNGSRVLPGIVPDEIIVPKFVF